MAIDQFKGENRYLSSMYPLEVGVLVLPENIEVNTVEIGYQADKYEDPVIRAIILASRDGYEAKRLAREVKETHGAEERPNWSDIKVDVMRGYVLQKFTRNVDLGTRLVGTGNDEIVEGNHRKDRFWGVCPPGTQDGLNWLGNILMDTRAELSYAAEHNIQPVSQTHQLDTTS